MHNPGWLTLAALMPMSSESAARPSWPGLARGPAHRRERGEYRRLTRCGCRRLRSPSLFALPEWNGTVVSACGPIPPARDGLPAVTARVRGATSFRARCSDTLHAARQSLRYPQVSKHSPRTPWPLWPASASPLRRLVLRPPTPSSAAHDLDQSVPHVPRRSTRPLAPEEA